LHAKRGHLPVVNLLINKGANIEASSVDGWRPLHTAASNGHLEIVKALIAKGADMNALTNDGQSALGFGHDVRIT
jgi:ankyrin repeat protein